MKDNAVIIIRAAGERTLPLCKKLILDQGIPENRIKIVQAVPFSAAMKKSFQLGIETGLKYTYCVDADVLLRPSAIEYMINEFEKLPENVCEIQGSVLDKFFGGFRDGGIHLYKTFLLKKVLKRIPKEGVDIRPEFYTLNKMESSGFPWVKIPYVVGIHDDEQYYYDIYRKCFVHGNKHISFIQLFTTIWKSQLKNDFDFQVALRAFSDSIQYTGDYFINKNQSVYKDCFAQTGFKEKNDINIHDFSLDYIENKIKNWTPPDIYYQYFPESLPAMKEILPQKSLKERLSIQLNEKGFVNSFLFVISKIFYLTGQFLHNYSKKLRKLSQTKR